jgi:diguanylate cyclase (GGDEF)-like protein/PAS domain S-box-containing protein
MGDRRRRFLGELSAISVDPGSATGGRLPVITYANWRHRCSSFVALWPEPFLEVDSAGTVLEWNPRAEEVFGWLRHEVVGRPVAETLLPDGLDQAFLGAGSELSGLLDPLRTGAANGLQRRFEVVHGEGHRVAVDARLFVTGQGPSRGLGGFVRPALSPAATGPDPAAGPWRDRARREDLLTGLPNRVHFGERLAAAVTDSQGVPGSVAVVLIDLDRFKTINNTMGHDFGDLVLASVASRLLKVAGDADLVARFGGDEFLALFTNGAGNAHMDASAFIDRVRAALIEPFTVEGTEVFLDASVGVALNTFGVDDTAELLSNAEAAMYQAKGRGGSGAETFGESMRIEVLDRMSTEHSLHRALERSELMLHYQPVVELEGVTTVGVEALVRWQHPAQGLVSPYRFIPVAEESGLIIPIGAWVLEEACHQLQDWQRPGQSGSHGSVEVNLSARQIDDPRIVRTVEQILSRTGLAPGHLTLEITESALMRNAASALSVLAALKELGVQLAIDDFGTGYSSLTYLQRFPLDILKVDRSFVEELGVSVEGEEIVSAVISLAHALGLRVVAEGVETTLQLEVLQAFECDLAQGYLFSKPLPASEIVASFGLPLSA